MYQRASKLLKHNGLRAGSEAERTQKKGSHFGCPLGWSVLLTDQGLGNVIAERRPDHVVHGVGRCADCCCAGSGNSRPAVPVEVGVRNAPLDAALFALVELVPEAEGAFTDVPGVTRAGSAAARSAGSGGQGLCRATTVVR